MQKSIQKKYTFSKDELQRLQNIEIGMVSADATLNGLHLYKRAFLEQVYKRLGLSDKEKPGSTRRITYNLSKNEILYTEEPVKKDMLAKK